MFHYCDIVLCHLPNPYDSEMIVGMLILVLVAIIIIYLIFFFKKINK